MKKKIIVPIDFSATSHNAYLYARELAKDLNANIDVIYVHTMTDADKNENFPEKVKDLEAQLADFVDLYPRIDEGQATVATKLEVTKHLLIGLKVKSILHACPNPASSMYVMGMTGSHNAVGRYFGTISSAVAQKAKCPVLLIPNGVKYARLNNILFASNYESSERKQLKQVTSFAKSFDAGIHFIHVREKNEVQEFTVTEERIYERLFEEGDPTFAFTLAAIEADSIAEGINKYAEENNVDLITLVNSRKGFLDLMFNKSITKKVAGITKLPLMVFHLIE